MSRASKSEGFVTDDVMWESVTLAVPSVLCGPADDPRAHELSIRRQGSRNLVVERHARVSTTDGERVLDIDNARNGLVDPLLGGIDRQLAAQPAICLHAPGFG